MNTTTTNDANATGRTNGMRRDAQTLSLYAALSCLGYLITGLGTILPELRAERDLSRAEVAAYPSAFAIGLVVVGLTGHRLVRILGANALPVALGTLAGGTAIITAGSDRYSAGLGALTLGLGAAGLVQLVPSRLRAAHGGHNDHAGSEGHGDHGTVAIGEANAMASVASVVAPLLIGAGLSGGFGWRAGFLVLPLLVALVLLAGPLRPRRRNAAADVTRERSSDGGAPRAFRYWWVNIVLAVSVEFCVLFWAVDFLRSESGLTAGTATTLASAFVLGMAIARTASAPVLRWAAGPVHVVVAATCLAALGFGLFWLAEPPAVAVTGLLITGLGVALLYPVTLAQALTAWPARPDRAAARCALASGVAIGLAPLLLGVLAEAAELRLAVLIAPALLAVLLVRTGLPRRGITR